LHDKYAGTQVKMDNEEYLILNIKDVLAIVG
ncbi:MAG: co-chaperone GroES, partial [Spirochaetales bacterium]|nr:co-chaperone GroES [Spirochaetales bacterium]